MAGHEFSWTALSEWLVEQAERYVKYGDPLPDQAVEWAARLVEFFDIKVHVFDEATEAPRMEIHGGFPSLYLISPQTSPQLWRTTGL